MNFEVGGFTFISDFDSGNLGRVELVAKKVRTEEMIEQDKSVSSEDDVPDFEFNLWTRPDCAGTEFENGNRTWFYFGIKGGVPLAHIQLNIVDLNKQTKMYSQGMAPVCRVVPGRSHWERIKEKPLFRIKDNLFVLTFKYRTHDNPRATTYFAFTYPYPYADLQNMLHNIDTRLKNLEDLKKRATDLDDIYYHRECVCYSLEGRRIDLITISSHHCITDVREPRLKYLFPENNQPRPFCFKQKKVVFVSARVHPGETPSSFVLNGFLNLLLKKEDPIAVLLRRNYVFKLIPMLNPDGVFRGHYRTDTRGVNLNRVYLSPSFALHPPIYAARSLILYYHHGEEVENVVTGPIFDPASIKLKMRCSPIPTESDYAELSDHTSPSSDLHPNPEPRCSKSNATKTSSIENQVSCLTLNENKTDHDDNLDNNFTSDNISDSASQGNDVLSVICETFIRKVFDSEDFNKETTVSVVGGGLFHQPIILETSPKSSKSSPAVNSVSGKQEMHRKDVLLAPRSETSLSVASVASSGSSGVNMKRNSLGDDCLSTKQKRGMRGRSLSPQKLNNSWTNNLSNDPLIARDNEKRNICTPRENSGIFLYMDLHGHASKKGIFMYGNHFDNTEDSIECMLLPKIMSLNSTNFHFSACNFTERNMYLRDRKDGSSREGCGRVSVLKTTGLVRSYTLECNYNTGRIVNVLPPCVRDSHKPNATILVPPKYTPHVYEEIGYALGASILDLTGTHPWSRIPNSEFRTINGIREWLRVNCVPEQIFLHKAPHHGSRHVNTRRQVCLAGASVRMSRPARVAASGCKGSLHENKRRLLQFSSKPKVGGSSNAHDCVNKTEEEATMGMMNVERKENVTSFQIISPPQTPEHKKLGKSLSDPKKIVCPGSSQKVALKAKKAKGVSGVGILKQVIVVRGKCTSVSSVAGNTKSRNAATLKINKNTSVSGNNLQKSCRAPYYRLVKPIASDIQMSGDCTPNETSNSSGASTVIDQSGDASPVEETLVADKSLTNKAPKYIKDETKGIVKHGPKRLKVSSFRPEQQNLASKNNPNKFNLKDMCYLNVRKPKKNVSKFTVLGDSIPDNDVASSSDNSVWESDQTPEKASIKASRQASLHPKNKTVSKAVNSESVNKGTGHAGKTGKTSLPGTSTILKGKNGNKSEKLLKNKVCHMSPIKSLKKSPSLSRKVSVDAGKKWGKTSLKNFISSVGKLRVAVKEDTVCIEKKRKKSKIKH